MDTSASTEPAPDEPPAAPRGASPFDALAVWWAAEGHDAEVQDAAHAAIVHSVEAREAPATAERAGLIAWFRIRVLAELRRRRRRRAAEAARRHLLAPAMAARAHAVDPAVAALARETAYEFRAEVRALPPDERTAFVAHYLRQESPARTAEKLFGAADAAAARAVLRLAVAATVRLCAALERRFGSPEAAWDALWIAIRHFGLVGGRTDEPERRAPSERNDESGGGPRY